MKLPNIKWFQVTGSLILGLVLGGYAASSFTGRFFLDAYYTELVAQLTIDVSVLKMLREGAVQGAIEKLDKRVDVNIISLGVPDVEMSNSTRSSMLKTLKMADEYRKDYHVRSRSDDTEKLVSAALARSLK